MNKYWYAFYTMPKHEFKIADKLKLMDIEFYLPTITTLKQWSDRKKKVTEPLFRGYIFVKVDEKERLDALRINGVVKTVSFGNKPSRIPDYEIENLQKLLKVTDNFYVQDEIKIGDYVVIKNGPFEGLSGVVVKSEKAHSIAVNIKLLGRSVLTEISNEYLVEPIQIDPEV